MKYREQIREILQELQGAQDAATYNGKGYIDLRPYEDQLTAVMHEAMVHTADTVRAQQG